MPVYPVLAAAAAVLFVFGMTAGQQIGLEPLIVPLAVAVGTTLLLELLWSLRIGPYRAGLVTAVLVVGFFGYGHAWAVVSEFVPAQWIFTVAWVLIVANGVISAWRAGSMARAAAPALNVAAVVVLAAAGWSLSASFTSATDAPPSVELTGINLARPDKTDLPDVYYIVLDRYAGPTALHQAYDFDNEPFLAWLEKRGFSVARHAHANYIKTAPSLTSSLNMAFLNLDALKGEATDGKDSGPMHRQLQGPLAVPRALKEIGYRYLQIANWWAPTQRNVDADRVYRFDGQRDFSQALATSTAVGALVSPTPLPEDPWDWRVMHENNEYALDALEQVSRLPGPKYVFAHLVTTHPPYVHNENGSFTGRDQVERLGVEESYRRQLTYANSRMVRLLDDIIARDPDAVIMLQADEGPFPARYREAEWDFQWRDATSAELEEKFGILYAMRVPGADLDAEGFHDALTPVNAFRLIFNARFGTDLPLLPDRTWAHIDKYHYYDMFEITERLVR